MFSNFITEENLGSGKKKTHHKGVGEDKYSNLLFLSLISALCLIIGGKL